MKQAVTGDMKDYHIRDFTNGATFREYGQRRTQARPYRFVTEDKQQPIFMDDQIV
jgi:hypothetical protein